MDEMTYMQISCYATPNSTDRKHVDEIARSILQKGWDGAPILVDSVQGICLTGSHRMAALQHLADDTDMDVDDMTVALDVHDILEDWYDSQDPDDVDELPLDNLRAIFEGTEVEEYKDQLPEW
ncbi:ParB N-terminal domain-containing protein [Bifidobacterium sp. A11]|uniref:ParB N-terminal domain-containing protein n=1 Tax=Bifidobacterium sp. A11 TaxID=1394176 RepID=UPI0004148B3B|nr:ParB N-terminal domain-containing protein [Bifidobacterium sp. A11]